MFDEKFIRSHLSQLQVIQEAINMFEKKNKTFKLASKEPNVEEQVSFFRRFFFFRY